MSKYKQILPEECPITISPYSDDYKEGYIAKFIYGPTYPFGGRGMYDRTQLGALKNLLLSQPEPKIAPDKNFSFEKPIFMGSGSFSIADKAALHSKIDRACYVLCGMQQNGGQGTIFDVNSDALDQEEINQIVEEIAIALGYNKELT